MSLVGAGPGDPELLTLKAVRVIAGADVLLVDDLVDSAVLAHARPDARIVPVGKRGGCVSTPQAFINRLMIAEARAGHRVVRLKGGDPFMFGRGGEEIDALRDAGIDFDVVPGITAAIAAAAAGAMPLTHRDHSQGVVFVTGHARGDRDRGDPDWRALAATGLTLVIYMGLQRFESIRRALLDGGMSRATPMAIVARASCPDQQIVRSSLGDSTATDRVQGPALFVIGQVAAQRAAELAERGFASHG